MAGFTVWLTGLSGSGKTTIAVALRRTLIAYGHRVELLDGDDIRRTLSQDLGFSKEHRDLNIRRIGFVARVLARNNVVVIVSAISPYRALRKEVRAAHATDHSPFIEVFVDCPLSVVEARDVKGLYAKALHGDLPQFTGVSDPYEPPDGPEIHVQTHHETVEESVTRIRQTLMELPAWGSEC
jgi:adenylylsulfate kinase